MPRNPLVAWDRTSISTCSLSAWSCLRAAETASSMVHPSASIEFIAFLPLPNLAREPLCIQILLHNAEHIVDEPVQDQPGWKIHEHHREDQRHEHHHFLLRRISGRRRHRLLDEHCDAHEQGQHRNARRLNKRQFHDAEPVALRQILDPAEKRGLPQFNRMAERLIQTDKHRQLHEHGQAAAQGINFVAAVELHHLFIEPLAVVLVLLPQPFQLGLELAHFGHGFETLVTQGEKGQLHQQCQQDDVDPIIPSKGVRKVEKRDQWPGNKVKPAEINGTVEGRMDGVQRVELLGTDVERISHRLSIPRDSELSFYYPIGSTQKEVMILSLRGDHRRQHIDVCVPCPAYPVGTQELLYPPYTSSRFID